MWPGEAPSAEPQGGRAAWPLSEQTLSAQGTAGKKRDDTENEKKVPESQEPSEACLRRVGPHPEEVSGLGPRLPGSADAAPSAGFSLPQNQVISPSSGRTDYFH